MDSGRSGRTPPPPLRLSAVHVNKALVAANRVMAAVHAALVSALIARRTGTLLLLLLSLSVESSLLHAAMVVADLTLLFLWALSQPGMWRPVRRSAFPDRLLLRRGVALLPGLDVVVVTSDPDKEPPLGVMNTVLSAMALDYPGGRLSVYLSDDAGSPLTLLAARKAYAFAKAWVPFCRKHAVQCPCPERYLAMAEHDDDHDELAEDRRRIKKMYETFKADLEAASKDESVSESWTREKRKQDHDAYVEIIGSNRRDGQQDDLPLLVYVSREKRPSWAHHFKAGALNALLRVSALLTNAPYLLVLDCDMACNTRSSAMEAMCFHLDADHHIAFVQFPQMFHNLSANDIYTNDLRYIFHTRWFGLDGLRGPILSGTGFYVRRDALYGAPPHCHDSDSSFFSSMDAAELKARFGDSDRLVASVHQQQHQSPSSSLAGSNAEMQLLPVASCAYEAAGTGWGDTVGFMYQCVVEDYFTGYRQFFSRGWTSAYYFPSSTSSPAFLGSMPTNLNDVLVQNKRWMSGMLTVGLSARHCPLACAPLLAISVPQAMAIAYFGFAALYAVPALCYATLPQLCFLRGVPLFFFPDDADGCRWLPAACLASSLLQHLVEVWVARRSSLRLMLRTFWNEQRFWMLNAVTGQLFGCVSAVQDLLGAAPLDFDLTAKQADDGGGSRLYQEGVFDFTGCSTLLLPATTLCVLNAAALLGGTWRMLLLTTGSSGGGRRLVGGDLFPQLFLLCYVAALSYPLLEGMFLRRDPARVPPRITALSVALAALLLAVFA